MKLLNIDANAKTVKGQKHGYMTAVMYLAPYLASGKNVCPMAKVASCWQGCLNTAGRGGIAKRGAVIATDAGSLPDNAIQRARLKRTQMYHNDRHAFMAQLVREIEAFERKAKRAGLIPVVRLNGTSDIQWETGHPVRRLNPGAASLIRRTPGASLSREGARLAQDHATIFEAFPTMQFYDYTKVYKRFDRDLPANYYLCLSYSEANKAYALSCEAYAKRGASLVVVARDKATKRDIMTDFGNQLDAPSVDGDETDLRFLDPAGAVVVLYAKGRARQDASGFVVD